MTTCGRCGVTDRPDRIRLAFRPLERDARRDQRPYVGPPFGFEHRCVDVAACTERLARTQQEGAEAR